MVHLIFVVKYRRKLLSYFGDDIQKIFFTISEKYGFDILEYNDDLDHAHLLLGYSPKYSITEVISLFKQISTYKTWRQDENDKILQKYFWKEQTFWSDGYFAASIGNASKETIERYIKEQG
jgi:putative transposase